MYNTLHKRDRIEDKMQQTITTILTSRKAAHSISDLYSCYIHHTLITKHYSRRNSPRAMPIAATHNYQLLAIVVIKFCFYLLRLW